MDFSFFEQLSPQEAVEFLHRFLRAGAEIMPATVTAAVGEGIPADFIADSVAPMLWWLFHRTETTLAEAEEAMPACAGDERSPRPFVIPTGLDLVVLRGSYHLGESFVRQWPQRLRWAVGDRDTAVANHPVVTGFVRRMELSPLLVVENLYRRALRDPEDREDIPMAISRWVSFVPTGRG